MTKKSSRQSFNLRSIIVIAGCFILAATFFHILGIIILVLSTPKIAELDLSAPKIILNGDKNLTIIEGSAFEDPGAVAIDDDESELEVKVSGHVVTSLPANYLVSYTATDSSGNTETISRTVTVVPKNHGVIYLTFDDGPSIYTSKLLDVLRQYNVKATFFVTGAGDDALLTREYNEGHAIGLHTFSHDYAYLYTSVDNFMADLYKVQERVKNATGFTSYLMRFPGGSSNTISANYDSGQRIMTKLVDEVTARGFTYFDWNVSSGDASGATDSTTIYYNVIEHIIDGGNSIVLQHDIKEFSVDAVESVIKWGLANGYEFRKLDASSFTAHHGINN